MDVSNGKINSMEKISLSGNIILVKNFHKTQKGGQIFSNFGNHFDHFLDSFTF